ncbi:MAG: glycoside hydrolase family 3 N-terminal domain-containing protein [Rikenellaceae bacterium]
MKKLTTISTLLLTLLVGCGNNTEIYKDPSQPTARRVESLISQMTLDEKLSQMNILVMGKNDNANNTEDREGRKLTPEIGAFIYYSSDAKVANELQRRAMEESRLGIPVLLGHDVIHGYRTLFPMPLAQACSWNRDLTYQAARIAAKESYLSGLRWTFSPMLDVARDGRWGRVAESYGEDPYANSEFAKVVVSGYQGENLSDKYSIAACLKHFAGYSYSQGGRDYNPTNISDLSLWETVLPPFKAAIESGAATVMSAFNDLNGEPIASNRGILTDVLRGRLGFDGFVVSDWRSLEQLITQRVAADTLDASVMALRAGNDMDMYDYIYTRFLPEALETGVIDMGLIDEAVGRILKVKFELGLFESPYTEDLAESDKYLDSQSIEVAKTLAEESMVLLKNADKTLPITGDIKHVLLVGPMVDDRLNMMGTWRSNGKESDVTTIYDGLVAEFGDKVDFTYLDGASFLKNSDSFIANFKRVAGGTDMIILALGEQATWSGENGSKASIELPESQIELVELSAKYNKPTVVLTSSGRPLALSNIEPFADAIVHMWQPGLYGGDAVAGILSGRVNPSGRLAITFPYTTGQIPIFYNHRANARSAWGGEQGAYRDAPTEPLYTFGDGLSYSEYEYSPLRATKSEFKKGERITVSVDVRNVGEMDGKETLLWYVDDCVASTSQPLKKLKQFEKRLIPAGKSERFDFEIDPKRDLSFVDRDGKEQLESGDFYIIVKDQKIKITIVE